MNRSGAVCTRFGRVIQHRSCHFFIPSRPLHRLQSHGQSSFDRYIRIAKSRQRDLGRENYTTVNKQNLNILELKKQGERDLLPGANPLTLTFHCNNTPAKLFTI